MKNNMLINILTKVSTFFKNIRAFYKRGKKPLRILKYFVTAIILLLILIVGAAEYTSRPSFCPTCHYMETFYQSWRVSAHNKVDCVECHFEPGISGTVRGKLNGLVQIVNYISLTYKKRKPWAEIPDNTCTRSGCHERKPLQDTTYQFKGVNFNHKNHLKGLRRGMTLKCVSCHSQIVQGTHIEVTSSTCFICHFKKSDEPGNKYKKLSDCKTCHDWKNKTKEEMANYRYDHTVVVQNNISCNSCHTNVVEGKGNVEKVRCFQCHFENDRLSKYDETELMHTNHVTKHNVKCFDCHDPIQHRIQKLDPNSPPDCQSCHSNAHSSQVSLFTGENGFGTENDPSIMYLNGINCRGCHIFHEMDKMDIKTYKASESSCEKCHGKGYDRLVEQWNEASTKRVAAINTIYKTVLYQVSSSHSDKKPDAEKLLDEANHNIKIVEIGKSVHNVQFADKLLAASYNIMKKALTVIGSTMNLPEFQTSAEFIPNECYNCHSGIQEISIKVYGMNFSHNQHIVKNRIACIKCHSNARKHGELILDKENCNACHHAKVNTDEECSKCHQLQTQLFNGNYMNQSDPDFMQAGGVKCIDCHSNAEKIIKPTTKICLKCHDDSYTSMAGEWKDDINKSLKELNAEIRRLNGHSLDNDQQTALNDAKKVANDVSSYSSIYVHNYDLLSTLISDKIKQLKKIE